MAILRAQRAAPGTCRQTSPPPEFLLDLDQRSNDLIDTELTFCAGRAQGRPMKDYQKHLEKLRADAALRVGKSFRIGRCSHVFGLSMRFT
jgi:hypothetical protein